MASPSSLPPRSRKTSDKLQNQDIKHDVRTLENYSTVWAPEVAKTSRVWIGIHIHKPRPIREDVELVRMTKVLNWLNIEFTTVCIWRRREMYVEVWILLEGKTPTFVLDTAEVP